MQAPVVCIVDGAKLASLARLPRSGSWGRPLAKEICHGEHVVCGMPVIMLCGRHAQCIMNGATLRCYSTLQSAPT